MPHRVICFVEGPFCLSNRVLIHSFKQALESGAAGIRVERGFLHQDADAVILAFAPLEADIAWAKSKWKELSMVIGAKRIWPIVWQAGIEGGLSLKEIQSEIEFTVHVWPVDVSGCLLAERKGQVIQSALPKSKLSRAIVESALSLLESETLQAHYELLNSADVVSQVASRLWKKSSESGSDQKSLDEQIQTEVMRYLREQNGYLSPDSLSLVIGQLQSEMIGLGPVESLMQRPDISEVMINGCGDIYVEQGGEMKKAESRFYDDDHLRLVISRMVSSSGRRVDISSPMCDARLHDGSRANVVLPPVSVDGPVVTIRRFRPLFDNLEQLIQVGSISGEQADQLVWAVRERKNIVVAGNSGSGKTTLLNALAAHIPDHERIITMEDAAELNIRKPHVVRMETRPANAEGIGEISMRDLVINALRMRPDRLVVGECRGPEVIPMLQAMNTGHDGSLTTLHANSAADVMERLEAMVLLGAPHWSSHVVRRQIQSAIHLVVYLKRTGMQRRLLSISPLRSES